MGPVATADQLAKVEWFVEEARAAGAEVVAGGNRPKLESFPDGFFYRPTIIVGADRESVDIAISCRNPGKMRQDHAFRHACGSAGVDDNCRVLARQRDLGRRLWH